MRIREGSGGGPFVFEPTVHHDERGFFTRTFDAGAARAAGLNPDAFIQDSQSRSRRGVVRGMHGRAGVGESKLVRVAHGRVFDVVVDARLSSATFGQVSTFILDDVDCRVLYVPRGFLHGHQTLSETADVCYRIDAPHNPAEDVAVHYLDPDLAISWPDPVTCVSDRDQHAGPWPDLVARLSEVRG